MTDLVELVAWLLAQLDEDERVALAAGAKCPAPWADRTDIDGEHPFVEDADGDRIMHHEDSVPEIETTAHIARHDPTRVLAEVEAKRAILEAHPRYDDVDSCCRTCGSYDGAGSLIGEWPCLTLVLLAQPYAGREGWREEWAS